MAIFYIITIFYSVRRRIYIRILTILLTKVTFCCNVHDEKGLPSTYLLVFYYVKGTYKKLFISQNVINYFSWVAIGGLKLIHLLGQYQVMEGPLELVKVSLFLSQQGLSNIKQNYKN